MKEKTIKIDSKYESSEEREAHKGGLKEKTLSTLKSFRDKIAEYFKQTPIESQELIKERWEELYQEHMWEGWMVGFNKYL